ncbi:MAG: hypothetical protein C4583_01590 [Anaerolineaceae bacterium]|nr:MAG: hypothetical protein C4583_01590 [Anaerolineaceae bacterium]
MLASQQFSSKYRVQSPGLQNGLGHVFAAAVVSRQFREILLEDPETALQRGYLGEKFELSHEERERLTSVRAHSLADLVKTIAAF